LFPASVERCVSKEQRRQEHLAKAKEAQEHAAKAVDSYTRESWERIAQGYRELAERQR
jgi:hypothetical protein